MSLVSENYKKREAVRKAVNERYDKVSRLSLKAEIEKSFGLSKDQLAELWKLRLG